MIRLASGIPWNVFRSFLGAIGVMRLVVPQLDIFYEEEVMSFLNAFDLDLIPWIIFINVLGKQLKKIKIPKWLPPVPALLLMASIAVCALFGWSHTTATGAKAVVVVLEYGLGNGLLIGLTALGGYDIVHMFIKTTWAAIKDWIKKRKETKKNGN
ncbi:MAG: hypothetical protein WCR70_05365 [Sphaerochaetaceae bacterium]